MAEDEPKEGKQPEQLIPHDDMSDELIAEIVARRMNPRAQEG